MVRYGDTYSFYIGGKIPAHASRDPEVIKHVLRTNHKNYQKSPFQAKELASYIGQGLLTNNGVDWLRQRRLIQPVFHRHHINKLVDLMERECDHLLFRYVGNNRKSISIHDLAMDITFHFAARALFSGDISSTELQSLRSDIERVQKMVVYQIRQPYKKWFYQLSGKIKMHKELAGNAKKLVTEIAIKRKQSQENKEDLLQLMLGLKYNDNGRPMSMERLADELIILLVAGHETSAQAVTWALSLLARFPDWQKRIREEITKGNNDPVEAMTTRSTIYAVIKETLRMYPPAWVIDRISIEEDLIQKKCIPPGSFMMSFIYGLHRHEAYWKNPSVFQPDRFLENEINADYFMPFGAGPRLCIGHHFAMLEQYVILKQIFETYTLTKVTSPLPGLKPLITLQPLYSEILHFNPIRKTSTI
jgi:cytochrome P450